MKGGFLVLYLGLESTIRIRALQRTVSNVERIHADSWIVLSSVFVRDDRLFGESTVEPRDSVCRGHTYGIRVNEIEGSDILHSATIRRNAKQGDHLVGLHFH